MRFHAIFIVDSSLFYGAFRRFLPLFYVGSISKKGDGYHEG